MAGVGRISCFSIDFQRRPYNTGTSVPACDDLLSKWVLETAGTEKRMSDMVKIFSLHSTTMHKYASKLCYLAV